MDNKKTIVWLNRASWLFLLLAFASFLGFLTHYDTALEAEADLQNQMLGMFLPSIDLKTILLAGVAALLGWQVWRLGKREGEADPKGKKVMICAVVCAVLTFTDLSAVSLIRPAVAVQYLPAGYEEVSPEEFDLYVFLGSNKSYPSDEDVLNYKEGYDGHARKAYRKYKICGYIHNVGQKHLRDLVLTFVLLDEEGNEVLDRSGQPCTLTTKEIGSGHLGFDAFKEVETNVVRARDLSATPVRFRLASAQQTLYLN